MAMKVSDLRTFVENGRVRHLCHQDEVLALWEKVEEAIGGMLDEADLFEFLEIPEKVEEVVRTFVREVHEKFEIDLSTEIPE